MYAMNVKLCRLLALAVTSAASALPAQTWNMNVDWKFAKLDWGEGLKAALAANRKDGKDVFAVDYDDSSWETVSVPHAVNAHDSYDGHAVDAGEASLYRGWMAYRKRFVRPAGRHFFLEFEAVRQTQYVYVNGAFAGFYEAGTAPTGYDVTKFLREGENLVCLVTDNTSGRGMKAYTAESLNEPGDWKGLAFQWNSSDFNPVQGGLTGNVLLHAKANDSYVTLPLWANLRTKGVYVWYDGEVHVEAETVGPGRLQAVVNGQTLRQAGDRTAVSGRIDGLTLWSPDTPRLYDVKVQLVDGEKVLDEVVVRTGFRTVAYCREKGLTINGAPTWLPGYAQRSTSSWAAIGVAPDWLNEYDMALVRESKANFVRWMHVTPKPSLVRACDAKGVVNVCPAGDKENDVGGRGWEQRVEAMRNAIVYFRNSPSVLFWEAGNNGVSAGHMKEMTALRRELDPHGGRFMGCRTISAPAVIAEAEYAGTMLNRHAAAAAESMRKLGRWMPIVETEYAREESARRLWDRFSPPDFNFVCRRLSSGAKKSGYNCYDMTQEEFAKANAAGYQEFYGNRATGSLGRYYSACAALCWSDCNQHGRNSDTENCRSSGRVDAVRIPKESFYVHQCLYSRTPQVKVLGHWNYPKKTADNYWYNEKVDDGKEITYSGARRQRDPEHKTVCVISSLHATEVELFVNGKSVGLRKSPAADDMFLWEFPDVDVTASGFVEAVARDARGETIAVDRVKTAGAPAKLVMRATTGPEGLRADGSDVAFVDLELVDGKGVVLPLANDRVTFRLEGPATFAGGWNSGTFDGTSPVGKDWVNLELGRNRVFVRAGREPGRIRLMATVGDGAAGDPGRAPRFQSAVELRSVPVSVTGGLMAEPPQRAPANVRDYTVTNAVPYVRDLRASAGQVRYAVTVNGAPVDFGSRPAFKPDGATGVCCAYEPLVKALKAAGADFEYAYDPKKVRKPMRKFAPNVHVPALTLKAGGKTFDAFAGVTVIFEDGGRDKNLTNFEMTGDRKRPLVGEMGPILGCIPGLSVQIDEKGRRVSITVK